MKKKSEGDDWNEEETNNLDFSEFFNFKKMITPTLIKIIYLMGMGVITIFGIFITFGKETNFFILNIITGISNNIIGGIIILVLGNIIWRICCESLILLYEIHERLKSIEGKD